MRRAILLGFLSLLMVVPRASAQDSGEGMAYLAFYKIGYADLPAWTELYHDLMTPVFQEMVDEGVITAFHAWEHLHGGEYNWRIAIRADDWSAYGDLWEIMMGRIGARDPDGLASIMSMIQAHHDEIFQITRANAPEGVQMAYAYDSMFQVNFGDIEAWEALWEEHAFPALNAAMADGTLGGWVTEMHHTGGRYNWKVIYLFEDWDTMDEFFIGMMGSLMADPVVWGEMGAMIQAHDDIIWAPVTPRGM
jgi:hypothetical protein